MHMNLHVQSKRNTYTYKYTYHIHIYTSTYTCTDSIVTRVLQSQATFPHRRCFKVKVCGVAVHGLVDWSAKPAFRRRRSERTDGDAFVVVLMFCTGYLQTRHSCLRSCSGHNCNWYGRELVTIGQRGSKASLAEKGTRTPHATCDSFGLLHVRLSKLIGGVVSKSRGLKFCRSVLPIMVYSRNAPDMFAVVRSHLCSFIEVKQSATQPFSHV